MKTILLLTLLFAGVFTSRGQSTWYQLQPNDTITASLQYYNLNTFYIYQLNTQSDTLTLSWSYVSHDIPAGWEYSVCDNIACYPVIPPGNTMSPIAPGDAGYMGLNLLADTGSGQALVRMYVYDAAHPNDGDTLTWIINGAWTSVANLNNFKSTGIYPNPFTTNPFIDLTALNTETVLFEVFDVVGKRMKTGYLNGGTKQILDVEALPAGRYSIRIRSSNGYYRSDFIKQLF